MRIMWAFIRRDFKLTISYKAMFASQILGIVFGVAIFYYVGGVFEGSSSKALKAYEGNYFAFLLIGVAFADYLTVSLAALNRSIQESQMMGTLEILLVSPYPFSMLLLCASLWPYLFSSLRFILYMLAGVLFFNLQIGQANVPGAVAIMLLSITSFAAIGSIVASITLVFKRGVPINMLITAVSILLGGVVYPVQVLPGWLKSLSNFIPITHSLAGMRMALLQGRGLQELLPEIAALLVFAAVLVPVAGLSIVLAVRRARIAGTMSHY